MWINQVESEFKITVGQVRDRRSVEAELPLMS